MSPASSPLPLLNTYRLQLNEAFTFDNAVELTPYLAALGVTHLYLSPIWTARPHSAHGYDICDHSQVNPALGGEDGFRRLSDAAAAHSMGLILDFVSNHMCADPLHNAAWRDVLRNGPSSACGEYFDIDWLPVKDELCNKVLLPILGHQYGEALESGELRISFEAGEFCLRYWEHNLPLNPKQCRVILRHRLEDLAAAMGEDSEALREYQSIIFQLDHLPAYTDTSEDARNDRLRELDIAQQRLLKLLDESERIRRHVTENVEIYNGRAGDPASFDLLHELLELQPYRLSYWRTALHEINYRRFFDVNELAGLRMEHPGVFDAAHAKVLELIASGQAHGLRLDHIDGLYDPRAYLQKLRAELDARAPRAYIAVEKILSGNERLSADWPVDGTTGYEFLNQVNRLYVRPGNIDSIRRIYRGFSRQSLNFDEIGYRSKQQIIATSMASELNVLAHEMNRISEQDRRRRDFTLDSLQEALREVVACFPVYRTYIDGEGPRPPDRQAIDAAIRRAIERNPAMELSIFSFIRECICPERGDALGERAFAQRLRFALKFQQYTGPVQAKGIEDTTFYRYCPLASLNEVGGEPATMGAPVQDFHNANAHRQAHQPRSMITTSTHDVKRGEDGRVRLNVISELPDEWRKCLKHWTRLVSHGRTRIAGRAAPDRNDEYLFFQSLLATWPVRSGWADERLMQRLIAYMAKAVKEAKTHSSWINPSNEYDAAVARFVEHVCTAKQATAFREAFEPFAMKVAKLGALNSISQLTLKLGAPGVVDMYQGSEFWELTLVDPDNRVPVDFHIRREWLAHWQEKQASALQFDGQWESGELKAALTALGLRLRRARAALFASGQYTPLLAEGPLADHVVAFARVHEGQCVIAAGLRWMASLVGDGAYTERAPEWRETTLRLPAEVAGRELLNVFTNERWTAGDSISFSVLFAQLPGALLAG